MPEAPSEPAPAPAAAAENHCCLNRLFRLPLLQKLIVADLLINITAYAVMRMTHENDTGIMMASLLLTMLLNAWLVQWSLLPLKDLELMAARVGDGDLQARVPPSRFADRHLARIGRTLNALLDQLMADQARVRHLSAQAIGAADAERAHLARELHDSTAQSLSAVEMMLTATCQETSATDENTALHARLRMMRDVVTEALRDVRNLSHRAHPSALEHRGLAAALEMLVRHTVEPAGVQGSVQAQVDAPISPQVASVFYRVAQEAIGNALRHGAPRSVSVRLMVDARRAGLLIRDDGAGFELAQAQGASDGMGLFVMRERLVLVDGELSIESERGRGTVVHATAPNRLEAA